MRVIRPLCMTGPVRLSSIPEHTVFTCKELIGGGAAREKGGAMIIVHRDITFRHENDIFHVYNLEEKRRIMIQDWEVVGLDVWPNATLTLVPHGGD